MGCRCTFKYGRETQAKILTLPKEEFSIDLLRAKAFQLITFPEGIEPSDLTLEFQFKEDQQKENYKLVKMDKASLHEVAALGVLNIVISTKQKPFSSWTFNECKTHFNLVADTYGELPKFTSTLGDLPDQSYIDTTVDELCKICTICPSAMTGVGCERSLLVFEILKQVTCLFKGEFLLKAQRSISGSLGNGPVDFAIEHNNTIIMITETKRENLDQGVAQCVIQLDTAGINNSASAYCMN